MPDEGQDQWLRRDQEVGTLVPASAMALRSTAKINQGRRVKIKRDSMSRRTVCATAVYEALTRENAATHPGFDTYATRAC